MHDKHDIQTWLINNDIEDFEILPDLSINVDNDVDLEGKCSGHIPVKFNRVNGSFFCAHNKLSSLQGSPHHVQGAFSCDYNNLVTLDHAPTFIGSNFGCQQNSLISLKGSPQKVHGNMTCGLNQLTDLTGAPEEVTGSFNCYYNPFESLAGLPQKIGTYAGFHNICLPMLKDYPDLQCPKFYFFDTERLQDFAEFYIAQRNYIALSREQIKNYFLFQDLQFSLHEHKTIEKGRTKL